jgi:hypothetical protein
MPNKKDKDLTWELYVLDDTNKKAWRLYFVWGLKYQGKCWPWVARPCPLKYVKWDTKHFGSALRTGGNTN